MPFVSDRIRDEGLGYLEEAGTRLDICSQEPTTFTEAQSTYSLGNKSIFIGSIQNGVLSGRRAVIPAFSDGSVTANGAATHWALSGSGELHATGTVSSSKAVAIGELFSFTATDVFFTDVGGAGATVHSLLASSVEGVSVVSTPLVDGPTIFAHGDSFTLTGTGFGTKSQPGPHLWDDCIHGDSFSTRWFGEIGGMDYRGVGDQDTTLTTFPHSNVDKWLCGRALTAGQLAAGPMFRTDWEASGQAPLYVFYYHRLDPAWLYENSSLENHKIFRFSASDSVYPQSTGYVEYKSFRSATDTPSLKYNDGDFLLGETNYNGSTNFSFQGNPPTSENIEWVFHEWYINRVQSTTDGYMYFTLGNRDVSGGDLSSQSQVFAGDLAYQKCAFAYNNRVVANSITSSDNSVGWLIGGFSREQGNTQYRYYCDIYVDTTYSRIMIGNNADYDSCTEVVPQVCSSWTDSSVNFTLNKGRLPSGTNYLFSFDASNNRTYRGTIEIA